MNFKEQYLLGLCVLEHIKACIELERQLPAGRVNIINYLGLAAEEYNSSYKPTYRIRNIT